MTSNKQRYTVFYICPKEREVDPYAVQSATVNGTPSKKTGVTTLRGIHCPTCRAIFKVELSGSMDMTPFKTTKKYPEHRVHGEIGRASCRERV